MRSIEIRVTDDLYEFLVELGSDQFLTAEIVASQKLSGWYEEQKRIAPILLAYIEADAKKALASKEKRRTFSKSVKRHVYSKSNGKCHYCGIPLNASGIWHIDHSVPIALGGTDDDENLVPSCVRCNVKKWAKTPEMAWSKEELDRCDGNP